MKTYFRKGEGFPITQNLSCVLLEDMFTKWVPHMQRARAALQVSQVAEHGVLLAHVSMHAVLQQ